MTAAGGPRGVPEPRDLVALGEWLIDHAEPGEQVEVALDASTDTELRAYDAAIEHASVADSRSVGVRVVRDGRVGFAAAGSFDRDVLASVLADARDNALFATPDDAAGVAEPDGVPFPELDIDLMESDLPFDDKARLALELEAAVVGGHPAMIGVESADYADSVEVTAIVSTTGVRAAARSSMAVLSAWSLAEADGRTTTGWGAQWARRVRELDVTATARDAVDRAVRQLGAVSATSGRVTVVMEPAVAAQFLAVVAECCSGDAVAKGRTFLAGRVGEELGSALFTLVDDPTDPRHVGATPFDAEGLATRSLSLFDAGVLQSYFADSTAARRLGVPGTASAVRSGVRSTPTPGARALVPRPGGVSVDDMISSVGSGILVTELAGFHSGVNPVSGDFSCGVEGIVIRDGRLAEPVHEATIASTLPRMVADLIAVGDTVEFLPFDAAGVHLAIENVTLSA